MMRVSNEAIVNIQLDPSLLIKKYEKEIKELKEELAMHNTLANRGRITYDSYSPEQQFEVQKQVESFLKGDIEELEDINSLRQVREMFFQCRNIYRKLELRAGKITEKIPGQEEESKISQEKDLKEEEEESKKVGEPVESGGVGLGKAPKESKPVAPVEISKSKKESPLKEEEDLGEFPEEKEVSVEEIPNKKKEDKIEILEKPAAFLEFKKEEGKDLEDQIIINRKDYKEKKDKISEVTNLLTNIKIEIDESKIELDKKRENNKEELKGDIIDEEEFGLIKKLNDLKKSYKLHYEEIKQIKSSLIIIKQNIDQMKLELINKFEKWYDAKYGELLSLSQKTNMQMKITQNEETQEKIQEEVDPEALAYIKAKKNVVIMHKVKKAEKLKQSK